MERLIITMDGPAGAGKSTVARSVASRLGLDFLDTGAMYRGIAALAMARGIDIDDEPHAVIQVARHFPVSFDWATDPPRLYAGERDLTGRLRDPDVTQAVSKVAAMSPVRQVLVEAQRRIGEDHPRLVTEGRDQGSIVFPNAEVKFYLDASAAVRAQRRAEQMRESGRTVDVEVLRKQIVERDHRDSTRKDGPLICPDDAQRIDTSDMTLEEVIDELVRRVEVFLGKQTA